MKVIIAGSRSFRNYSFLTSKLDLLFSRCTEEIEIVSGTARGTDTLGEHYAHAKNLKLHKFPAAWNFNGRSAGYIRNEKMAKFSDALVAFWDGKSRGTHHMIDLAKKHSLRVRVVRFDLI